MRQSTRQELLKNGICPVCGNKSDRPDKCMCSDCQKRTTKRRRENYSYRKRIHICVRCGKRKAEPNKTMCIECIDSEKIRNAKSYDRDKAREAKRKLMASRVSKGMCPECGKHPMYMGGECKWCRAKQKRYRDCNRKDIDRSERPSYGLCYICGKPIGNFGKKVCPECYKVRMSTMPYVFASLNNEYWKQLEYARRKQDNIPHAF